MDKTSEQAGGRKAVRRRLRQIAQIKELLRQADDAWSAASSATGTASMAEAFDFFSKSTAVSFYSAMQSAQAASQIEHAQAAMRRLNKGLTDMAAHIGCDADIPNDLPDLAADLLCAPDFDFLSALNYLKLNAAGGACSRAKEQLAELSERIEAYEQQLQDCLES